MADGTATRSSRGHRAICLPLPEGTYPQIVSDPRAFRATIDEGFRRTPELFPKAFAGGYQLKDDRVSAKQEVLIRRIGLNDGTAYSIRPSFLMPYMVGRVGEVEGPLFLRAFGVPFWALARVSGGDPMSWFRMECGLGRYGAVGTTVRRAELPVHLLADEHHQTLDGQKIYMATAVGGGCVLGAEPAAAAGTMALEAAHATFKEEARDLAPKCAPRTVNTDGWKGTRAAWKALFRRVVILQCFLHGWLKIRDRARHLGELFAEVSRRAWGVYHAPDRRCSGQRLRSLRRWAAGHPRGVVLEKVEGLCDKRPRWSVAYRHPDGHRTSNRLDRQMRGVNRYFDQGRHQHGSHGTCRLRCRAWALLWNFTPWHPATARANQGRQCPAERFNRHRHHDCWLQNLLISASLGGYRCPIPQNP